MIVTKSVKFCRKQSRKVYLAGEHACAFLYAVCEFIDAHIVLIAASLILLAGIIFITLDEVMTWFGNVIDE